MLDQPVDRGDTYRKRAAAILVYQRRAVSLVSKVLQHLCCSLSQVPGIQPTSDLNQSLTITSIFSSFPCFPVILFFTHSSNPHVLSDRISGVLSSMLRLISNYPSSCDLIVFSSHEPIGHLDQLLGGSVRVACCTDGDDFFYLSKKTWCSHLIRQYSISTLTLLILLYSIFEFGLE